MNFYAVAIQSFQENLNWIEKQGRKDSPDWHLANGLLRLTQALKQYHDDQEELSKSFARSEPPSKPSSGTSAHAG
jgi:hypothetical protein